MKEQSYSTVVQVKPEGLDKGYFARPTIFINVDNHMTIAQEEIFGPVMSVITIIILTKLLKLLMILNMVLLAMLLVKIKIH